MADPDDPAAAASWLERVAHTRLGGGEEAQSSIQSSVRDGVYRVVLTCASPSSSSAAVAEVLLAAVAAGPTGGPAGRLRPGVALSRGVQVEVQQSSGSSGGAGGPNITQISFKSAEPEAAASLERAARLFEAYLHYHVKTTKSHLHTRMRQQLTGLQQELKSCAHSSFAPTKARAIESS